MSANITKTCCMSKLDFMPLLYFTMTYEFVLFLRFIYFSTENKHFENFEVIYGYAHMHSVILKTFPHNRTYKMLTFLSLKVSANM